MNSSQTVFSQTNLKSTYKSAPLDYGGTSNFSTKTRFNPYELNNQTNNATLKGKIQNLEDQLNSTAEELNDHKKDVSGLQLEKNTLQDTLIMKTQEVKNSLLQELDKVEEEMKRHYSHQIAENNRMLQQISALKSEKTTLMNQLIALQRRILDLEQQVGTDEFKS